MNSYEVGDLVEVNDLFFSERSSLGILLKIDDRLYYRFLVYTFNERTNYWFKEIDLKKL